MGMSARQGITWQSLFLTIHFCSVALYKRLMGLLHLAFTPGTILCTSHGLALFLPIVLGSLIRADYFWFRSLRQAL